MDSKSPLKKIILFAVPVLILCMLSGTLHALPWSEPKKKTVERTDDPFYLKIYDFATTAFKQDDERREILNARAIKRAEKRGKKAAENYKKNLEGWEDRAR